MELSSIIIDFESSGLGEESYPIEVGWVNRSNPTHFDSFLIRPDSNWYYWDSYAENSIHGISRDHLFEAGISVEEACTRLNQSLAECRVLSDAALTDRFWMSRLFRQAQISPMFSIGSIYEVIPGDKADGFQRRMKKEPVPHRALADAQLIAKAMNFVSPPT